MPKRAIIDHYSPKIDHTYCKAMLAIGRCYAESIYTKTNAASISAHLLGPRQLKPVHISTGAALQGAEVLVNQAALAWKIIATRWALTKEPFPHIYALLFFLEVLAVGRKLLYRGQFNGDWDLETTLHRKLKQGWDLNGISEAKRCYVDEVHTLGDRRHLDLVGPEPEALCQHYGFPTHYLDFTWDSIVAAFFALGGEERYLRPVDAQYPTAAIWVVDVMGASSDAIELVTLPAQVMRPWLQRAEFLNYQTLKSLGNRPKIAKLVFRHKPEVWIEELFDLGPYSIAPLSMYLIPRRDPLEETAAPILEWLTKEQ